jgi:hypothetical protein
MDIHSLPGGEALHFGILLLSTPTAVYALLSGVRFHTRSWPLVLGIIGLGFLWTGSALDSWRSLVTHSTAHSLGAFGSAVLIWAHVANRRAVKAAASAMACGCGHHH